MKTKKLQYRMLKPEGRALLNIIKGKEKVIKIGKEYQEMSKDEAVNILYSQTMVNGKRQIKTSFIEVKTKEVGVKRVKRRRTHRKGKR